jgi:hypothetical protein
VSVLQNFSTQTHAGIPASQRVRAPGQSDQVQAYWIPIAQTAGGLSATQQRVQEVRSDIELLSVPDYNFTIPFHPFRIYQLPHILRTTVDWTTDWKKFRVRAGSILVDGMGHPVEGTDGHDLDTDTEAMAEADMDDIVLPDPGETYPHQYWIWIETKWQTPTPPETNGWTFTIRHAADPKVTHATHNPTPWATWPDFDGSHITIGVITVANATAWANREATVRQFLRADLILGPLVSICIGGQYIDHSLLAVKAGLRA